MDFEDIEKQIVLFIKQYSAGKPLIVGVSGGVDSGVVSTLCSLTGNKVYALGMPCSNSTLQNKNMETQLEFLRNKFSNTETKIIDITLIRNAFISTIPFDSTDFTRANMNSRMRMVFLYMYANQFNGIVAGTGNKNEDFILYFFTKYGDGGVDISPIGDLYKSEVFALASFFHSKYGLPDCVAHAIPTDGLWNDGRSDEAQLGISYNAAERLWKILEENNLTDEISLKKLVSTTNFRAKYFETLDETDLLTLIKWNLKGTHKSKLPPVCVLKKI